MSKPNIRLKEAIVLSGYKQYALSSLLGIEETRFSKIVHGRIEPNDEERDSIVNFFGSEILDGANS